jgi:hypothetical protein
MEGQEVPIIAAQVTAGPNAPSVASIQIIPLDEGQDFYPRTMVHVFYLDTNGIIAPAGNSSQGTQEPGVASIALNYRLLFSGEVIGFAIQQAPDQRSLTLQCVDFSSYWDAAHALAIEYGPGGNAFSQQGSVFGGSVGTFDDIANQMPNKLMQWIGSTPQTPGLQSISGLAGGIIRMLEAMGGVPGHYKGINDFFTAAELRCRILSQITAEENDNTAKRILNAKVLDQWIRNGLNNMGQQVTFRDMMKLLFQYIYYEFVPNPAAKWDPAIQQGQNKNVPGVSATVASSPSVQAVSSFIADALSELGVVLAATSPDETDIAGTANTVLADINQSISNINALKNSTPQFAGVAAQILNGLNAAKLDVTPLSQPVQSNLTGFVNCQTDLQEVQNIIAASPSTPVVTTSSVQSSSVSQRLRTQIIKPDCWFVAPPKCNVIFPEMYTMFSYERSFLTEVTRSLVQFYDTLIGPDKLLSTYALLPNIGSSTTGIVNKKGNVSYRTLMDHEIHTGIIPRHERLSNLSAVGASTNQTSRKDVRHSRLTWGQRAGLFNFFKYRFAGRQMSVSLKFNPFLVCGFPAVLMRKPYIIPGISNQANSNSQNVLDNVVNNYQTYNAPYQYLGNIGSLVHGINQGGGVTTIQLTCVRKHIGMDDEFLNQFITDPSGPNLKVVKTVFIYNNLTGNIPSLKLLASCTPQGKSTSSSATTTQKQVTQVQASSTVSTANPMTGQIETQTLAYNYNVVQENPLTSPSSQAAQPGTPPPPLTIYGQITGASLNRTNILVPNPYGKLKPQSKNGKFGSVGGVVLGIEVLDPTLVQDPNYGQMFSAVALYEQVPVTLNGTAPFEEVVRPPWFSPNYANAKIGANIYNPFFGCDSLVDDLTVLGLSGTTPLVENDPDSQNFSASQTVSDIISTIESNSNATIQQSVQNAVNTLAYIYGQIKLKGLDVDQFIRNYVDRPIATMTQVLGSDDLQISVTAAGVAQATQGQIGYFSASINPVLAAQGAYAGLAVDPNLGLKRIDGTGKNVPIDPRLDVRKSNLQQVVTYLTTLGGLTSNAFIG